MDSVHLETFKPVSMVKNKVNMKERDKRSKLDVFP